MELNIIDIPFAILLHGGPAMVRQAAGGGDDLTVINGDRKVGCFVDQHTQKGCVAVAVATPVVRMLAAISSTQLSFHTQLDCACS